MSTYTVDEGANTTAINLTVSGTSGTGYISLPTQSPSPATPASGVRFYADSSGRFSWLRSDGFKRIFDASLTADRTYTFPDATGEVVTSNSTVTLTNKTIIGGSSGNTVSANQISGATISGTPSSGAIIVASSPTAAAWTASSSAFGNRYAGVTMIPLSATTTSATYVNVTSAGGNGVIIYPGSSVVGITRFDVQAYFSSGTGSATVRLYDVTNAATIASISGITQTSSTGILTTSTITNVPASSASLQVQMQRDSGTGTFQITGIMILRA